MRTLNVKVVGVSYEGRQAILAMMHGDEAVRIVPEPENAFDHNALAVYVAFSPERNIGVKQVGYISKELAKDIAPALDGESMMVSIAELIGGFKTYDGEQANYGLRIKVELPEAKDLTT